MSAWNYSPVIMAQNEEMGRGKMEATMKALVYRGPGRFGLEDVPAPRLIEPDDVIGRVILTTISGSDIRMVRGGIPDVRVPLIVGHEFCAEIVETGPAVKGLKIGDRVVVSCVAFCGECRHCRQGQHARCTQPGYGSFGLYGPDGSQAEFVRMPRAELYCSKIPESLSPEEVLFCGDILPAGCFGAELADIHPGETVVVVGSGPVGLCAMMYARLLGASRVIAVDTHSSRLDTALKAGLADLGLDATKDPVLEVIREETGGSGADKTIECAGTQATFDLAFRAVRGGGKIATVSIYEKPVAVPLNEAWGMNVSLTWGFAPPGMTPELITLIERGKLSTGFLCTHQAPLNEILQGYDIFGHRKDGCLKWLVTPWEDRSACS